MPDQTSGRSDQVSGYIRMYALYKSDHIVATMLLAHMSLWLIGAHR